WAWRWPQTPRSRRDRAALSGPEPVAQQAEDAEAAQRQRARLRLVLPRRHLVAAAVAEAAEPGHEELVPAAGAGALGQRRDGAPPVQGVEFLPREVKDERPGGSHGESAARVPTALKDVARAARAQVKVAEGGAVNAVVVVRPADQVEVGR